MKDFGLKFIDIMIGIVLGLGFQWWTNLQFPWQYLAFIFVYVDIVDYWVDYSPSVKKFPPKREVDLILDVAIMFSPFLYIYTTQQTILHFLFAFALFSILDCIWCIRARQEYHPGGTEGKYLTTWIHFNWIQAVIVLAVSGLLLVAGISPLATLIVFIAMRIVGRIAASYRYKKVYLA